ncbi:MAG TPA: class I SAM-dependent methyltransferase [Acetobacteraceae bacterium]|nr:class I SAM-dependent methyltransferase [Acetobacteraceae bacterium]
MISDDPLAACLNGHITPEVAIARMLLAGEDVDAICRRVDALPRSGAAWAELERLAQSGSLLRRLRQLLDAAGVDHAAPATPAAIAALFDRAVAISPEASVAFYSLGDGARLQSASEEIRDWLHRAGLLALHQDVLDLGCGIGRVASVIAPHARTIVGVDVSQAMLREARQRCTAWPNISFFASSGLDLLALANGSFDLVLAVDSFPYLVQAGVAEVHIAEARRVLRPGGCLVILNLSYRSEKRSDRKAAETWARRYGLRLTHAAVSPFRTWDALAYILNTDNVR